MESGRFTARCILAHLTLAKVPKQLDISVSPIIQVMPTHDHGQKADASYQPEDQEFGEAFKHLTETGSLPSWTEQLVQFLMRYLFALLGILYFNFSSQTVPYWFPIWLLTLILAAYCIFNTVNLRDARGGRYGLGRIRVAMWIDICMVTTCLLNDPYDVPPSIVAYLMVVLGNGMRYGLGVFAEAVLGSFLGAILALSIRYWGTTESFDPGLLFLPLFAAIIVVYSYVLMIRVESSRRKLETHSRHDALTGLLNRRGMTDAADYLIGLLERGDSTIAVAFADIDDFKRVNDTLGHQEGDRILKNIAGIFKNTIRQSDLVARWGGDEFVMLFPRTTLEQAKKLAQRQDEEIEALSRRSGVPFGITFGLIETSAEEDDLDSMLAKVDREMYRAKKEKRSSSEP